MRSLLVVLALALVAAPLFGHCDSLGGPVVTAAREALSKGDVTPVLKWIPASKEGEIRDAFAKTLAARAASAEAREVADRWFFETLVRVHRQAEGAPFTGLTGAHASEGIELADQALDTGSLDAAQKALLGAVTAGLHERFAEVVEAKKHANESVEAGRRYVRAYVEFIHYAERLHDATIAAGHHE